MTLKINHKNMLTSHKLPAHRANPQPRRKAKRQKEERQRKRMHGSCQVHVTFKRPQCHFHTQQKFWNSPCLWPSRTPRAQIGSEHDDDQTPTQNNVRHDCSETQKLQGEKESVRSTTNRTRKRNDRKPKERANESTHAVDQCLHPLA